MTCRTMGALSAGPVPASSPIHVRTLSATRWELHTRCRMSLCINRLTPSDGPVPGPRPGIAVAVQDSCRLGVGLGVALQLLVHSGHCGRAPACLARHTRPRTSSPADTRDHLAGGNVRMSL